MFYIKESNDLDTFDVIKLDDELIDNSIDFIKIDTEWCELFIFGWCKKYYTKYKPLIQVEINSCSNKFFNYDKEEIYKFSLKWV